jgi:hypothetical protein
MESRRQNFSTSFSTAEFYSTFWRLLSLGYIVYIPSINVSLPDRRYTTQPWRSVQPLLVGQIGNGQICILSLKSWLNFSYDPLKTNTFFCSESTWYLCRSFYKQIPCRRWRKDRLNLQNTNKSPFLMIKVKRSPETLVLLYQTTYCHVRGVTKLHYYRLEKLKSQF